MEELEETGIWSGSYVSAGDRSVGPAHCSRETFSKTEHLSPRHPHTYGRATGYLESAEKDGFQVCTTGPLSFTDPDALGSPWC